MKSVGAGTPVRPRDLPLHEPVRPQFGVVPAVQLIAVVLRTLGNATFPAAHAVHYLGLLVPLAFTLQLKSRIQHLNLLFSILVQLTYLLGLAECQLQQAPRVNNLAVVLAQAAVELPVGAHPENGLELGGADVDLVVGVALAGAEARAAPGVRHEGVEEAVLHEEVLADARARRGVALAADHTLRAGIPQQFVLECDEHSRVYLWRQLLGI